MPYIGGLLDRLTQAASVFHMTCYSERLRYNDMSSKARVNHQEPIHISSIYRVNAAQTSLYIYL